MTPFTFDMPDDEGGGTVTMFANTRKEAEARFQDMRRRRNAAVTHLGHISHGKFTPSLGPTDHTDVHHTNRRFGE